MSGPVSSDGGFQNTVFPDPANPDNTRGIVINPLNYGAVGDGTHDDTQALNSAWAQLPLTGGIFYLPPDCTFLVTSTVQFGTSNGANPLSAVKIVGGGVIQSSALSDWTGKAVVQVQGVSELYCEELIVRGQTQPSATEPAVGFAITRDSTGRGGNFLGRIDIAGAFSFAAYYNIGCENSHMFDSQVTNYDAALCVYDSSSNAPGLSISPVENQSNTRKTYKDSNFLGYATAQTQHLIRIAGGTQEVEFKNSYFYHDNGHVFDITETGSGIQTLRVIEVRGEVNTSSPESANDRFLYATFGISLCVFDSVKYLALCDAIIELNTSQNFGPWDARQVTNLDFGHGDVFRLSGGAQASQMFIDALDYTVNVETGSYLIQSFIRGTAVPPVIGGGIYGYVNYQNYLFAGSGPSFGPQLVDDTIQQLNQGSTSGAYEIPNAGRVFYIEGNGQSVEWMTTGNYGQTLIVKNIGAGTVTFVHNAQPVPPGYSAIFLDGNQNLVLQPNTTTLLYFGYGATWGNITAG